MKQSRLFLQLLTLVTVILHVTVPVLAQVVDPQTGVGVGAPPLDYRVGAGDKLLLTVPQRPELNREVVVENSGAITLPLIGAISVTGMTAPEIEQRLLQAIKDYYPSVTRIQVAILTVSGQYVYIMGAVARPGKYSFAGPVNLWEAIREAGGPMGEADLENVQVVRDRTRGGASQVVSVATALASGAVQQLPDLDVGDTAIVPQRTEVYTGSFGVYVMGQVIRPGIYRLEAGKDLMSTILLAGGPTTRAKLEEIRIVRPLSDGTVETIPVDLNKFLANGYPAANPALKPGDTVNIPSKNTFVWAIESQPMFLLNVSTALLTLVTLLVAIDNSRN